jgi:hypothetical protein
MKNILLGIIAVAIVVTIAVLVDRNNGVFGSVIQSQEYESVRLTSTDASSTKVINQKLLAGSLGSIVIASSTTGTITFYDSATTTPTGTTTAEVIAKFGAELENTGTYQYDLIFTNGLLIYVSADFNGDYVVTYR